jgi:hypothetical protein
MHARRYKGSTKAWEGAIGTIYLKIGEHRGDSITTSYTTSIWDDYADVYYSGEYEGEYLRCQTDNTSENVSATYVTGEISRPTHYMYCDVDLIPKAGTVEGGCSIGSMNNRWYEIYGYNLCGVNVYYRDNYSANDKSDSRVKNSIELLPE